MARLHTKLYYLFYIFKCETLYFIHLAVNTLETQKRTEFRQLYCGILRSKLSVIWPAQLVCHLFELGGGTMEGAPIQCPAVYSLSRSESYLCLVCISVGIITKLLHTMPSCLNQSVKQELEFHLFSFISLV